jgi:hypothetical protein
LLSQFRFGWYPPALGRKRLALGENISLNVKGKGWTEEFGDDDWDRLALPWVRGYHGLYIHRSTDSGMTYETIKIDTGDFRDGYTRTGVRQLESGRLAYVVTEHHAPYNRFTYVVFSDDDGRSWSRPAVVYDDPERLFGEPDVVEHARDELYVVLRESRVTDYLHGCRSEDGGQTWSPPEKTTMYGYPGQLVKLEDGRILCTYGRRKAPYGIRAALSEDGGRNWLTEQEIIVRDDLPNGDLGYPTTIEYSPGKLFCIYYAQDADGVTCVMGSYFEID